MTSIEVTQLGIALFKKEWARLLSAFSIFDPKKVPSLMSYLYLETVQFELALTVCRDLPAKLLEGTEFEKAAIVSSDLSTEWKTYRQLLKAAQR